MSGLVLKSLQQALYSKLSGDSVLMDMVTGIFDYVPQTTALPYIMLGDGMQKDKASNGLPIVTCILDMHVWTTTDGRKTVLTIMDRLYALLHLGTLTIEGQQLVLMRCENAQTELSDGGDRLHGKLSLLLIVAESA